MRNYWILCSPSVYACENLKVNVMSRCTVKLPLLAVLLLSGPALLGCAHDPEPFAREDSVEEQHNQEAQQSLRERQYEMDRQEQMATRRENEQAAQPRPTADEDADERARRQAQADARERLRESSSQIELPGSGSALPSIRPVLGR